MWGNGRADLSFGLLLLGKIINGTLDLICIEADVFNQGQGALEAPLFCTLGCEIPDPLHHQLNFHQPLHGLEGEGNGLLNSQPSFLC